MEDAKNVEKFQQNLDIVNHAQIITQSMIKTHVNVSMILLL